MFAITKASASFRNGAFSAGVKQRTKCERMLGFGLHFFEGGKTASAELELKAGVVGAFITGLGRRRASSTIYDDGWFTACESAAALRMCSSWWAFSLVGCPLCSQVQYLQR